MGWLNDIAKVVESAVEEPLDDAETIIDRWENNERDRT